MLKKKSGVATRITADQSKVPAVYCHGHSLRLAVKQFTSSCEVLGDTMGTVGEISALVNFHQKEKTYWQ